MPSFPCEEGKPQDGGDTGMKCLFPGGDGVKSEGRRAHWLGVEALQSGCLG